MKYAQALMVLLLLTLVSCTETPAQIPTLEKQDITTPEEEPYAFPEGAIVVSSTEAEGEGSFRAALESAHDGDLIVFDPAVFLPDSPAVIQVPEELPHIHTNGLTIDASEAGVVLDGSQVTGEWVSGLQIVSANSVTVMGLQITNFPGPAISVSGSSTENVIGGDRSLGGAPYGQGNLFVNNAIGVSLASEETAFNTIKGNYIGTDLDGNDWMGNNQAGVTISEDSHDNTIGPDNEIANNFEHGVYVDPEIAASNTLVDNQIYDNGIYKGHPAAPVIIEVDFAAGTASGASCPGCTVSVYSTSGEEGELLEGETTADEIGVFKLDKGAPFEGPSLTAMSLNEHGKWSVFTWPPVSPGHEVPAIQVGNEQPMHQYYQKVTDIEQDNHLSVQYDSVGYDDHTDRAVFRNMSTGVRLSLVGIEPDGTDWSRPDFYIDPSQDEHIDRLVRKGVSITYVLMFWDMDTYPNGEGAPCYRFKTEDEIDRYMEYVRFIVDHFKGRIEYYEIWNEPDIPNFCPKSITLADYLNLIEQVVPVIRDADPDAKVVVGATSGIMYADAYRYLLGVLSSDMMPLVDAVSWHPMYGVSPEIGQYRSYYYHYPDTVAEIKETATAAGFEGQYFADELTWRNTAVADQPGAYPPVEANKYFLQSAIMHRGLDINVGIGAWYFVMRPLGKALEGLEPVEMPFEVESSADNLVSYSFLAPDGSTVIALWRHDTVAPFDPGVETRLVVPGMRAGEVLAIDLLHNLSQPMSFEMGEDGVVINQLLVKYYPLLIVIAE